MDISLIEAHIFFETCKHVAEVCLEGSMSQNLHIGLSFCFMLCRRWNFDNSDKKYQKFAVFGHKITTRALTKNLRHASLDRNVFYTWLKAHTCRSNLKQNFHVQKIKVVKSLINLLLLMYTYLRQFRLLFDVLFVIVAFIDPEISRFY